MGAKGAFLTRVRKALFRGEWHKEKMKFYGGYALVLNSAFALYDTKSTSDMI